jgi:proton-coupled amino acid transporter
VALYPSFLILNRTFIKKSSNNIIKYNFDTIIRIFIVIISIFIGIFSIGRFDTLLALVGGVVLCPISLIFPTLFHFLIFKKDQSIIRSFFDLFIFSFGIILSLTVLVFTIFPIS